MTFKFKFVTIKAKKVPRGYELTFSNRKYYKFRDFGPISNVGGLGLEYDGSGPDLCGSTFYLPPEGDRDSLFVRQSTIDKLKKGEQSIYVLKKGHFYLDHFIQCKEEFLYEYIEYRKEDAFSFAYSFNTEQIDKLKQWTKKLKSVRFNFEEDHVKIKLSPWWDNYYRLGWLCMILRNVANVPGKTNSKRIIRKLTEFSNNKFDLNAEREMYNTYNWLEY